MSTKTQSHQGVYAFRLYVVANTPRSVLAISNLKKLCEMHLAGRYRIEVIDILKNPELAKADHILAVPTLVRKLPTPIRKFIGNLSDPERVLVDFELVLPMVAPLAARKSPQHA